MSFAHDEEVSQDVEGGYRQRHMSVSNYAANVSGGYQAAAGRRRSSIVPAGSVPAAASQSETIFNQKDETLRKMSVAVPNLAELTADAKTAAESERAMSFREGVRLYPKAMFFSFALSLAVVMEGYDTWLLGGYWGMPAFAKKYGQPAGIVGGVQQYQVPSRWQSAIGNGTATAQIIGLMINGIVSERIGYRKTMIGSLFLIICFIFITFFAINVKMLLAGYCLSGLPWYVDIPPCRGSNAERWPKGRLSDVDYNLCGRSHAGRAATVLDDIRQLVLGHWTAYCCRCSQGICVGHFAMVLSRPVRHSMDLAHPNYDRGVLRARITMVCLPLTILRPCRL